MKKLNQTQIALILIVIVLGIGAFMFKLPQKVLQQAKTAKVKQTQSKTETLSIAGKVGAVNVDVHSFTLISSKGAKEIKVVVGNGTKIVRLVFPFDLKNPPASKTFTPKLEPAALKDLKAGDQAFVRASEPIKAGQDVVNPIEVQILP